MTEATPDSLYIHMVAWAQSGIWSWRMLDLRIWHKVMQMMMPKILTEEINQN